MVTVVNNNVWHTWMLLRVDFKSSHHGKNKVTMWDDGCDN